MATLDHYQGPDVSFTPASKMRQAPQAFTEIVPDLASAMRSGLGTVKPLIEKPQQFIALGSQVGILVDP